MSSTEKLKCQKTPLVLRYHVLSEERFPEEYTRHMFLMYFTFRGIQRGTEIRQ